MAHHPLTMVVTLKNRKALKALVVAANCLDELADVMPWRPEAKRAAKALRYATKHLAVSPKK